MIPPERLRALLVAEADLGERIMRALILRRVGLLESQGGGPVLIGHSGNAELHGLENFLRRNGHPYIGLDADEDSAARALLERFHIQEDELPIVLCPNGDMLRRPTDSALARCLGLVKALDPDRVYDVVIVGAGPAGLAASVYAASEGLEVLTLDCRSFGGQAGASARIENFLGFPTGISGMALMARAYNQAQKFGVEMAIPDEAARLECPEGDRTDHRLTLANGETARGRAVVLATGARYRRLGLPDLEQYEGGAIHYWASPIEARLCAGQPVALVGGGNSAGQAAVFLASKAAKVTMLARRPLAQTMSRYLIERIAAQDNIELIEGGEVTAVHGIDGRMRGIDYRNRIDGTSGSLEHRALVPVHRRRAQHRLAGEDRHPPRRARLRAHRRAGRRQASPAGNQPHRHFRHRRRARGFGQARRGRGGRRRASRRRAAWLSGGSAVRRLRWTGRGSARHRSW